jgi:hypothetical protein
MSKWLVYYGYLVNVNDKTKSLDFFRIGRNIYPCGVTCSRTNIRMFTIHPAPCIDTMTTASYFNLVSCLLKESYVIYNLCIIKTHEPYIAML